MDESLSTVIIAVITGVVSLISILIQKKQDKVVQEIDTQVLFIKKEQTLKSKLKQKEAEREAIIDKIIIMTLDTNLHILKNTMIAGAQVPDPTVFQTSELLKGKFLDVEKELTQIKEKYVAIMELKNDLPN